MRCSCCNKALSDRESTRKGVNTGDYLDMCDNCFSTVSDDFPYVEGHGSSHVPLDDVILGDDDGAWEDWQNHER